MLGSEVNNSAYLQVSRCGKQGETAVPQCVQQPAGWDRLPACVLVQVRAVKKTAIVVAPEGDTQRESVCVLVSACSGSLTDSCAANINIVETAALTQREQSKIGRGWGCWCFVVVAYRTILSEGGS